MLSAQSITLSFGVHRLVDDLGFDLGPGDHMGLVGPNGCGKTTLLRVMAGRAQPESGRVTGPARGRIGYLPQGWEPAPGRSLGALLDEAADPSAALAEELERLSLALAEDGADAALQARYDEVLVVLGYLAQEQEGLDPARSALELLQARVPQPETEARSFLHHFLFTGDASLRPSAQLSYGERARLALALLVAGGCNLLLLDEPTNHLDIPSRERFEQALAGFGGSILAVSHDRYFLRGFATERWWLEEGGLRRELGAGGEESGASSRPTAASSMM